MHMKNNKNTGFIPDKLDARDVYLGEISFSSQDSKNKKFWGLDEKIRDQLQVEDQKKHGSCVGQTFAKFFEVEEIKKNYSARYIYTMTDTLYEGRNNGGLRPSNALKFLRTYGAVTDDIVPDKNYLSTNDYYKGVTVQKDGKKILGHVRVEVNIDDIKQAFDQFGCIPMAVSKYRTRSRRTGQFIYSDRSGGHAILATHMEYKNGQHYIHFINSWGKGWGKNGFGYIKFEEELKKGMKFWFYGVTRDAGINKKIQTLVQKKKKEVAKYKYFSPYEIVGLSPALVEKLDQARGFAGIPFVITSGYRTKAHNEKVGGVADSAHTKGLAVDLRVRTSSERYIMMEALKKAGFKRFGIGSTFIHVDIDSTKPQNVMWTY